MKNVTVKGGSVCFQKEGCDGYLAIDDQGDGLYHMYAGNENGATTVLMFQIPQDSYDKVGHVVFKDVNISYLS